MEVDFALLSDRADIVNGKLYMIGGAFDTIFSPQAPVKYQSMTLAMRFMFSATELNQAYKIEVRLIDDDGKKIISIPGQIVVKENPGTSQGYKTSVLTAINFFNTQFPKFGDYSFDIFVGERCVKSVSLRLIQRMPQNPPPVPPITPEVSMPEPPKEEPPKA